MPVCLMTLHAFGTWAPDRPDGYWHHTKGLLEPDPDEAARRRAVQTERTLLFSPAHLRLESLPALTYASRPAPLPAHRRTHIRC